MEIDINREEERARRRGCSQVDAQLAANKRVATYVELDVPLNKWSLKANLECKDLSA